MILRVLVSSNFSEKCDQCKIAMHFFGGNFNRLPFFSRFIDV